MKDIFIKVGSSSSPSAPTAAPSAVAPFGFEFDRARLKFEAGVSSTVRCGCTGGVAPSAAASSTAVGGRLCLISLYWCSLDMKATRDS